MPHIADNAAVDVALCVVTVFPSANTAVRNPLVCALPTTSATGRRIEPKQVYYDVVTYELVVGSTIPALDGALDGARDTIVEALSK